MLGIELMGGVAVGMLLRLWPVIGSPDMRCVIYIVCGVCFKKVFYHNRCQPL